MPVFVGEENEKVGSQYLRLDPISSELIEYNVNAELREYTINIFLYFGDKSHSRTKLDAVLRLVSRIEALIHDNISMTFTNENSKGDEQANIDDNQNKWETNTSQIRNDLTDLQTIIINDDGSYTEEEIKAAKDRYNQKMNELKTLHDDNDRQSSDDVIQFETFANDNEINLDFSFVETKENKKGPEGESPVILNLNNRKLELQELLNTTEDAEEYKKIKKQIYDIDQEITSLQNPDFTEEDIDPETKTLTKDEKSFIDKLGGPGTLVSLGMLGMAAPALLKDVEVQDYPELSSAMDEHIK